jgi:hypothetical protein
MEGEERDSTSPYETPILSLREDMMELMKTLQSIVL